MSSELMRLFQFSEEDLAHNKQGRLSPRQMVRLKRNNRLGASILFILLLVTGFFTIFLLLPFLLDGKGLFDDIVRFMGGVALGLLSLLFFTNFLRFLLRSSNPSIAKVQGKVSKVIKREERDQDGDKVWIYYAEIGGEEIKIQARQAKAFLEGHTYIIFRDAILGVLSVEDLGKE